MGSKQSLSKLADEAHQALSQLSIVERRSVFQQLWAKKPGDGLKKCVAKGKKSCKISDSRPKPPKFDALSNELQPSRILGIGYQQPEGGGFGWNINEGESPTRVGNWIEAFNFSKLKSLILHSGNDTGNLLDAVCQMDTPLKLKKLELVQFDQGFTDEILQSFQGLESLYIMHGQEELPPDFRNSVGFRYGSLKRLVAHRKLPYPEKEKLDSWLDDTKTLFSQWYLSPDVDRIGLVKGPAFLQSYIKATMQLRYQPKWKVLHFRRSMNDFFLDPQQSIEQVIHEIHFHR